MSKQIAQRTPFKDVTVLYMLQSVVVLHAPAVQSSTDNLHNIHSSDVTPRPMSCLPVTFNTHASTQRHVLGWLQAISDLRGKLSMAADDQGILSATPGGVNLV